MSLTSSDDAAKSFIQPSAVTPMDDYYTTINISGNSTTNVDVTGIRNDNEGAILSLGGGDEESYTSIDPVGNFGDQIPTITLNQISSAAWSASNLDKTTQVELSGGVTSTAVKEIHDQVQNALLWSEQNTPYSPPTTAKQPNLTDGFKELYADAATCGKVAVGVANVAYSLLERRAGWRRLGCIDLNQRGL